MIIQYHTTDLEISQADKDYFQQKLQPLTRFLGAEAGDRDSVRVHLHLEKNRHQSGDNLFGKAHMTSPHKGDFMAEEEANQISALADLLSDTLARQARKFHQKHVG